MIILSCSLEQGLHHDMRQDIPVEMVPPLYDAKEIEAANSLLRPAVPGVVPDTEESPKQ
jgi:hypothetical protein